MIKKLLPVAALLAVLPLTVATGVYAEEPPPGEAGAAAPDDPNAQPYPPDGVTDPNAQYPTDPSNMTDQGETGAEPPAAPPSDAAPPADAAPGDAPPADAPAADAPPGDATPGGAAPPPNGQPD